MKKVQRYIVTASACVFAGVPNYFQAKMPARASEVNANFQYLDSLVATKINRSEALIKDSISLIDVSGEDQAVVVRPYEINFLCLKPNARKNGQEYSLRVQGDGGFYLYGSDFDFEQEILKIDALSFNVNRQIVVSGDDSVSGSLRVGGASRFNSDLRVNGTLYANIQSAKIPDFVFSPQYELMPLAKVEEFTQQFQHLPGIPSANEMEKEQVDLVRMNMLLLQKIEELTLHVIRQQKEIDALKISR